MFANTKKPLYLVTARNEAYRADDCLVQVYVRKLWRDRRADKLRRDGFDVRTLEVTLPSFKEG